MSYTGYQFTNELSTNYASLCSNVNTSKPQHTCRHFIRRFQLSQPVVTCGQQPKATSIIREHEHIRLTDIYSFWTYMLELTSGISEVTVAETRSFLANVNSCSCSLYVVVRPSVCRLSVVCLSSVCRQ